MRWVSLCVVVSVVSVAKAVEPVSSFVNEPLLPLELGIEKFRWEFPSEKGQGVVIYTVIDRHGKRGAWMQGNTQEQKGATILVYDLGFLTGENDGAKLYMLPGAPPQRVSADDTSNGGGGMGVGRGELHPMLVGGKEVYRLYAYRWHGATKEAPAAFAVQVYAMKASNAELRTLFAQENDGFFANRPLTALPPVILQAVGPVLNAPPAAGPPKAGAENF